MPEADAAVTPSRSATAVVVTGPWSSCWSAKIALA